MTTVSVGVGAFAAIVFGALPALAGEADVLKIAVTQEAGGTYRFDATIQHADTGWDHYANAFEILTPKGDVVAVRELVHPHEQEQPFTRSLNGVSIDAGISQVLVRAHDSVHGYGGVQLRVALPGRGQTKLPKSGDPANENCGHE